MKRRVLIAFVGAPGRSLLVRGGGLGALPHRGRRRGVLGYSCAALPTLLTGAPPSRHGRMCLFARASGSVSVLAPLGLPGLLPRPLHQRPWLSRLAPPPRPPG